MDAGLLGTPFLERLNLWFLAALGLLAAYWLGRVALSARRRQRPAVTLWSIPGLLMLLLAPLTEVPALFGLGAAVLLIAEWWPRAFIASKRSPVWGWGLVLLILGGAAWLADPLTYLSLLLGGALSLWGLAQLLSGLLWPRSLLTHGWLPPSSLGKRQSPTFGTEVRWRAYQQADPPDLSVTVGQGYLLLHNETGLPVHLRGWAPSHRNAFLALDKVLAPGAEHRLSRESRQQGVRVWYSLSGQPEMRILRADWQPTQADAQRVLN